MSANTVDLALSLVAPPPMEKPALPSANTSVAEDRKFPSFDKFLNKEGRESGQDEPLPRGREESRLVHKRADHCRADTDDAEDIDAQNQSTGEQTEQSAAADVADDAAPEVVMDVEEENVQPQGGLGALVGFVQSLVTFIEDAAHTMPSQAQANGLMKRMEVLQQRLGEMQTMLSQNLLPIDTAVPEVPALVPVGPASPVSVPIIPVQAGNIVQPIVDGVETITPEIAVPGMTAAELEGTLPQAPVPTGFSKFAGDMEAFAQRMESLVQRWLGRSTAEVAAPPETTPTAPALTLVAPNTAAPVVEAKTTPTAPAPVATPVVTQDASASEAHKALGKLSDRLKQARDALAANLSQKTEALPPANDDEVQPVSPQSTFLSLLSDTEGDAQGDGGMQGGGESDAPEMTSPIVLSQSAAKTETPAPFAKLVEQAQNGSPAEQVVAHVRMAIKNNESRILIQLHPLEMGRLDIRMDVTSEGRTQLSIMADNTRALEALRGDARVLERMLTDIGFKTDNGSLSFNLRGDGQQQAGQERQEGQRNAPVAPLADPLEETLMQTAVRAYTLASPEGLDIRI